MRRSLLTVAVVGVLTAVGWSLITSEARAETSEEVKARFKTPPREYASAPLWVWNDRLTEEQIRGTMRDLAGQKVRQVFVHPRPGLMTPYLSKEWFDLWKIALDEAEKLDMNVWIYDENSYPSGFAGGLVPEAMPESRGKGIHFSEATKIENVGDDVVAVYQITDDGFANVTKAAESGEKLPEGQYMIARLRLAPTGGWFGGTFYVDLLKPGVTEKFIDITMEAYRRELGEHFGKRLPGWFTDEPHLAPAGGLHWSDTLVDDFKKRWGYNLTDHLPSLVRQTGDWKRVRHNYQQLLLELFIDRWAKPCHDYCEKYNLQFTGHYWEHGWPGASHGPDNMAMYAWHQTPAIDTLMNEYRDDTHAQFGNARAVKELASVANQMGRERTLCEAYGAGGWDLRFEDMKRIGDWLYVLGVNTMDEHLSYITIRGARKRDHPQSFSYHEPWWDSYHVMAEYFTRLSVALSSGKQVNNVLVLEPTTSGWMYQNDGQSGPQLAKIGNSFQDLVNALESAQVEYDLGSEDILARHGANGKASNRSGMRPPLHVGKRSYYTVILPPHIENLNSKTMGLLEKFVQEGGVVICGGAAPSMVDGRPSDRAAALAEKRSWHQVEPAHIASKLGKGRYASVNVYRAEDDPGILFHHRRFLEDGQLLFLVNTSLDSSSKGTINTRHHVGACERWDPTTGNTQPYPFETTDKGIKADFAIPPCGSLLLFLPREKDVSSEAKPLLTKTINHNGDPKIRRVGPNVLTLDYVDITAGGETKERAYVYGANRFAFQQNGMERNPWDSAVQFRDKLITKTFPADSGFSATYRFTIEQSVPKPLHIVIERSDLYEITCNGKPVEAKPGQWWLDKAFGKIDLTAAAKVGKNEVTIKASPMTIYHELESAYVLGNFTLKAADSGFAVAPPKKLLLNNDEAKGWNRQGHPFYAEGVAYTETFDIAKPEGKYAVSLPAWYGAVAKVAVNGEPAGHIAWQPWQCDVTGQIRPGKNTIEVTVIGTLKNTLGPHHAGEVVGRAWPNMFHRGPEPGPPAGENYHTLDYGLFEPFVLQQTVTE